MIAAHGVIINKKFQLIQITNVVFRDYILQDLHSCLPWKFIVGYIISLLPILKVSAL